LTPVKYEPFESRIVTAAMQPIIHIVDDDEAVRLAIGMLMESYGWRTRQYASAREFLLESSVGAGNGQGNGQGNGLGNGLGNGQGSGQGNGHAGPSCLILDLNMPDMNGAELLEALVAAGRWLPVVVITAFADNHLAARARSRGVRAVLRKPVSEHLLIDHIRQALGLEQQ
jgi:two-component system response regulator FixJ